MSDTEKSQGPDEPKLVVDTDWKEQVAREKEQAQQAASEEQAQQPDATDNAESATAEAASEVAQSSEADSAVNAGADSGVNAGADSGVNAGADSAVNAGAGDAEFPPPPPASFEVLISMMFTQAMAMLGQMPDPSTGQPTVNKPYAKHYIDTLDMLGEKTKGNLSEAESNVLSEALHALRMMYVSAGK